MSENESKENAAENTQRQVNIQKIYIKDASFEAPHTPRIFSEEWQPEIGVQLQNAALAVGDNIYEVVLTVTITAKVGDKTAYLAEVHQAGIFEISGIERDKIPHLLGSYCPHTLFPYLRQALHDLVSKGGFPDFIMAPINFEAIFQDQMQKKQQQQADTAQDQAAH